jgi:hypothetical protein
LKQSFILKRDLAGNYQLVDRAELSEWLAKNQPDRKKSAPFEFKKVERGTWVWRDGQLVRKSGQVLQFKGRGLQVIPDIAPFRNVAVDDKVVGGRAQKRDMMKRYNLAEMGSEKPRPVERYDARKHQASMVESLKHSIYKHTGEY